MPQIAREWVGCRQGLNRAGRGEADGAGRMLGLIPNDAEAIRKLARRVWTAAFAFGAGLTAARCIASAGLGTRRSRGGAQGSCRRSPATDSRLTGEMRDLAEGWVCRMRPLRDCGIWCALLRSRGPIGGGTG